MARSAKVASLLRLVEMQLVLVLVLVLALETYLVLQLLLLSQDDLGEANVGVEPIPRDVSSEKCVKSTSISIQEWGRRSRLCFFFFLSLSLSSLVRGAWKQDETLR